MLVTPSIIVMCLLLVWLLFSHEDCFGEPEKRVATVAEQRYAYRLVGGGHSGGHSEKSGFQLKLYLGVGPPIWVEISDLSLPCELGKQLEITCQPVFRADSRGAKQSLQVRFLKFYALGITDSRGKYTQLRAACEVTPHLPESPAARPPTVEELPWAPGAERRRRECGSKR